MSKKEIILSTALKLFAEAGFQATPTSLIAREAGVATGTLFHHFKTKEELILALFLSVQSQQNEALLAGATEEADLENLLKLVCENYLSWFTQNREAFLFLRQFYASPLLAMATQQKPASLPKTLEKQFYLASEAGQIKPMPAELFHLLLQQHVYGLFLYLQSFETNEAGRAEVETMSSGLFWDMIRL